mmetsp:Transcript_100878/g.313700  ORF Transcript_100878/g.313700 Transcript_100878/m.313700 type:complete len:666 (+) Transcript_100878:98-2095(+)
MACGRCCRRVLGCCCAVPLAFLALLAALAVPQLLATPGSCEVDAAGACKAVKGDAKQPVKCADGAFIGLVRQPRLALAHFPVGKKAAFAELRSSGGCVVQYALACSADGVVMVHEDWKCSGKGGPKGPPPAPLGTSWEVCPVSPPFWRSLVSGGEKQGDGSSELLHTQPLTDLSFDVPVEVKAVAGCVRVTAPGELPQLRAMRGTAEEQVKAMMAARAEIGGCPTWSTPEDRMARGDDFAATYGVPFSWVLRAQMRYAAEQIRGYQQGDFPKMTRLKKLPLFAATVGIGGVEGALSASSLLTCGMLTPALLPTPGIQVTRHGAVADLIADPTQKRAHILGGGSSEVCFDPTLPVFLSSGSPEHTQVRRLWDQVGVDRMHLGELSEVVPGSSLRQSLLGAVGFTMPMMDEVAELVTPLFMEKLWQKKPSVEETQHFASYTSFGAPCIASQVLEKLPIVPGKVLGIRAAVLKFAKDSPVGRAMAKEIEKPEYAELRRLYSTRDRPVIDTALQNLADASMFAGLVGTSSMTFNCVSKLWRSPDHVKLFRRNSSAFLWELMRVAPVVGGSQQALKEPMRFRWGGEDVELPAGALVGMLTGIAAGVDASVFPDPFKFDIDRPNIGEMMTWNGKLKYALSRNYTGAPRFCPGTALSVRIAAKVCGKLTEKL